MNRAKLFAVHAVSGNASAPPPKETKNPSSTICLTSWILPAPSDSRIAISRQRATKRTRASVATLALVSSSTTPAIARRIGSVLAM